MRRRDGTPIWVSESTIGIPLRKFDLRPSDSSVYDEEWLQDLLFKHPEVLPIKQIESGFGRIISVCRELPVNTGYLDNFYVTAEGGLVIVEAKLWRNPKARREAVAQAMDYAAAIFRLTYEELQASVLRSKQRDPKHESLHSIVVEQQSVDEVEFIDAVSRNLRRGRAIVAVVGDGIHEDTLTLAKLLQSHAGHRFTFSLVELGVYESPQAAARIVIPSVLAQTMLIERGVVSIEDSSEANAKIVIRGPTTSITTSQSRRPMSISEDEFYDALDRRLPGSAAPLRNFVSKAAEIGFFPEFQGALNLKHAAPTGNPLNLGTIGKVGWVDTSPATWWGRTEAGRRYNQSLADLIRGAVRELREQTSSVKTAAGRMPLVTDLLPQHEEAWLAAMEQYVADMLEVTKET